jgi:hypothetical protein
LLICSSFAKEAVQEHENQDKVRERFGEEGRPIFHGCAIEPWHLILYNYIEEIH